MIRKIVTIHCSDTPNNKKHDIELIRHYHKTENKWRDVGYHFVIQPDGEVQVGRPLNQQGAHVKGFNSIKTKVQGEWKRVINVGVCMVGKDKFTRSQFTSMAYILDALKLTYKIEKWGIYCHYEFAEGKKTCPNMRASNLYAWYWLDDESAISEYIYRSK